MKKFLAMFLMLAVLLTCCACAGTGEGQGTLDPESPEAMFGHIDETVLLDGQYQIWSKVGVQNIANHPDARFTLLCNVDMGGETITPIPEFTGTLNGANFTISNFKVQGDGEKAFGFVGVNKGKIRNLLLDQVTFMPGSNAEAVGSLAGRNENEILRCTVSGTITVEHAAQNTQAGSLVGVNTGSIANTVCNVDLWYNEKGSATVGGIAGSMDGGSIEFVESGGQLTVTGEGKTVGLLAGQAKNAKLQDCAFLGQDNSLNGKLFNQYFGREENLTTQALYWRDNSSTPQDPNKQKLRDTVVQAMYEMCTIRWYPTTLPHSCNCSLNMCNGVYSDSYEAHIGMPYNHKNGSLARFKYCLNEDGTLKDWVYDMAQEGTFDTFDLYMGNDCSTAVLQAWLTVSNSVNMKRAAFANPMVSEYMDVGIHAVGDWAWDIGLSPASGAYYTDNYTNHNGVDVMYEAYAMLQPGDAVNTYTQDSNHTRMVSQLPVVVRDENGKISGQYSYVLCHEQGVGTIDQKNNTYSFCRVDNKYTFDNLFSNYYIPITIEELVTGQMEEATCTLEGGVDDSRLGLTTGVVKANYSLDYVTMVITDEAGNQVFDHVMFPTVTKRADNNSNDYRIREVLMEYDLAGFAVPLRSADLKPGETYRAQISGYLATGDSFVVHDFTFTNG